ncbi:hypothetical protein N8T08_001391 [Aspergillus melleus]|uniref:Uncharacterized protein n=1 Tax=Aspergillus melleus TaxID=138277 RepID=A0ACC3BA68_9EURO|nr:hypothetical protein N8T08_001391 [Aspergillus melleus]
MAPKKAKSQKTNKGLKATTIGKKVKVQATAKVSKAQAAGKNSKVKAKKSSKGRPPGKRSKAQTTDTDPEVQETRNNSNDQATEKKTASRKRRASELGDLILQPRVLKKPKIFLNLKLDERKIQPSRRGTEIIAAIYWDINNICLIQGLVSKNSNDQNQLAFYRSQHNEAQKLVRMAVDYKLNALSPAEKEVREVRNIARFARNFGWRTLAICAWAEAFRRACLEEMDPAVWKKLLVLIRENSESVVYFARLRNLDWRGLLLRYSNHPIPELRKHLKWVYKWIGKDHPHHFVRTISGGLRRPSYKRRLQEHMDECLFDPANWAADGQEVEDPTLRQERHGDCALCGSSELCGCKPGRLVAGMIELVEYPAKGTGIRALTNFKKGELLAEYVGEIQPGDHDDVVYGLYLQTEADGEPVLASISSQFKGNWTRFINHSCNPSTEFEYRTIGNRVRMTVEALRDIPIFEELTISYGEWYWPSLDRWCQCGEPNCMYKKD